MPRIIHNNHCAISVPVEYSMYMFGCNASSIKSGKEVYYDYAIATGTSWLIADYECYGRIAEEVLFRR
jgi:hypothetical protein